MIIPIRCFTCNKVVANKWSEYNELRSQNIELSEIFDKLGLKRYCCKRMLLTNIDLTEIIGKYDTLPEKVTLKEFTTNPRMYFAR
jgi:DNA-directed RNA polymerase I, II, and III subunit RPABC5